jgi:hypothetical protein
MKNYRYQYYYDIIQELSKKLIIVSLKDILKKLKADGEKISGVSSVSYSLLSAGINLKEINAKNYVEYMENQFVQDLKKINTTEYTLKEVYKKLKFPKSIHLLKKILYGMDIKTKEKIKENYFDFIKSIDCSQHTLTELHTLSQCPNKIESFRSKMYSTDIMFKGRKIIDTPVRKKPIPEGTEIHKPKRTKKQKQ